MWRDLMELFKLYFCRKERTNMVALYVALIVYGRRTFDQVPKKFQDAVREDLAALGLDENGNPLPIEE